MASSDHGRDTGADLMPFAGAAAAGSRHTRPRPQGHGTSRRTSGGSYGGGHGRNVAGSTPDLGVTRRTMHRHGSWSGSSDMRGGRRQPPFQRDSLSSITPLSRAHDELEMELQRGRERAGVDSTATAAAEAMLARTRMRAQGVTGSWRRGAGSGHRDVDDLLPTPPSAAESWSAAVEEEQAHRHNAERLKQAAAARTLCVLVHRGAATLTVCVPRCVCLVATTLQ